LNDGLVGVTPDEKEGQTQNKESRISPGKLGKRGEKNTGGTQGKRKPFVKKIKGEKKWD